MNCDNVRNTEGVWIHFGLTVYLISKVKTMQCYFTFNYSVSTWTPINVSLNIV